MHIFARSWTSGWLRILLVSAGIGLCGMSTNVVNAQQPSAEPGQRFGFDYVTADLTTFQVSRFEQAIDGGAWTDLGLPAGTVTGSLTSYAVAIPALTPGTHTVSVRACNTVCGMGSIPFTFQMIVQPPAPSGVRIVGLD